MLLPRSGPRCRKRAREQAREARQTRKQTGWLAEQARLLSVAALHWSHSVLARSGRPAAKMRRRTSAKRRQRSASEDVPVENDEQMLPANSAADAVDISRVGNDNFVRSEIRGTALPPCWLGPDDFLSLVYNAGLRGDDSIWMDEFDRLGGNLGDDRVNSDIFVSLVMDDLARHCQQTRNSLQDMLKIACGSARGRAEAQSECAPMLEKYSRLTVESKVEAKVECMQGRAEASAKTILSLESCSRQMPSPSPYSGREDAFSIWQGLASTAHSGMDEMGKEAKLEDRCAEDEVPDEMSNSKEMPWQSMAMEQLDLAEDDSPKLLSVWSEKAKKSAKAEKGQLKSQKHARKDPLRFDPIPELSAEASLEERDWSSALQDIFIS